MSRLATSLRAGVYASAFVLLWVWIGSLVRPLDARIPLSIPGWLRAAGIPIAVAGALIDLACVVGFATTGGGTPAPFDPPREVVASGPYRFVRNPMYLGAELLIVGVGLALGSPSLVALAAVFAALAHALVVLYEEPALERRFGERYLRYKASVARWRPKRPAR